MYSTRSLRFMFRLASITYQKFPNNQFLEVSIITGITGFAWDNHLRGNWHGIPHSEACISLVNCACKSSNVIPFKRTIIIGRIKLSSQQSHRFQAVHIVIRFGRALPVRTIPWRTTRSSRRRWRGTAAVGEASPARYTRRRAERWSPPRTP